MSFRTNKAHPWHGIPINDNSPNEVTVFIEIVPRDTVKYEVDKETGYLKIDRRSSILTLFRRTTASSRAHTAELVSPKWRGKYAKPISDGDNDPLDILVLSEHHIPRGDIILKATPIGGFCLIDGGEADDKIIAVLKGDKVFEQYTEIAQLPKGILERFEHYFLTYKSLPDANVCEIAYSYGREESYKVINAAIADYDELIKVEV